MYHLFSLYFEESATGYIIRNETVVEGENYKNGLVPIKTEGEKVSKGDPVFRYYSNNEENLVKKIEDLDKKIQEAMSKDNSLFSSDIKLLDTQIESKLSDLYELNDIQKIKEYKNDINTYVTKKAKIAGELSPAGSYIKKLIDESFLLDYLVLDSIGKEEEKVSKTELSEKLVGNMIEKVITMDSTIDEKKLKDLIDKQYSIIKYKTVVNEKQIEEIYKKYMDKYLEDIKLIEI